MAIEGIVGLMGAGKTLFATYRALDALKQGIPVYANYEIALRDPQGNVQAEATTIDDMKELFLASLPDFDSNGQPIRDEKGRVAKKLVIIDEVNLTAPSRYWKALPPEMAFYWSQSRKLGLTILWTAQHEKRVDTMLREITYCVWHSHHIWRHYWYTAYLPGDQDKAKQTKLDKRSLRLTPELCRAYDTLRLIKLSKDVMSQKMDLDGPAWRDSPPISVTTQTLVSRRGRR